MTGKKELGSLGEKLVQVFLKKRGYKILDKNFRTKWGEIDIIAEKKNGFVFIEVKTIRKKNGFSPEDEITPQKKRQLLKMTQIYLSSKKISPETPCQIDILAVEIPPDSREPEIRHYENAIEDSY